MAAVWLNLGPFLDDLGVKFDDCVDETSIFLIRKNTLKNECFFDKRKNIIK